MELLGNKDSKSYSDDPEYWVWDTNESAQLFHSSLSGGTFVDNLVCMWISLR